MELPILPDPSIHLNEKPPKYFIAAAGLRLYVAGFVMFSIMSYGMKRGQINAESKRAIVFLTSGERSLDSFSHYSYSETASWLNNNGIAFMSVLFNQTKRNEEIDYLTKQTPGNQYYVYRNEGLACIASDLCALPNGHYRLSFVSKQDKNFGLSYLPVEVEVYLQNRSGRDESGYFAPLE